MKIEFENGSIIEVPENVENTRGKMSEYILWFNTEEDEENEEL